MSGIAGVLDFGKRRTQDRGVLKDMTVRLTRPDGEQTEHQYAGLVQLGASGGSVYSLTLDQGDLLAVFCGELYETWALRTALSARGHAFTGEGEAELVLRAYLEHRAECAGELSGVFAFAVWDPRSGSLLLCRDRLGVKPLFLARREGMLIFASELRALLGHPLVRPEVDAEGLAEIFAIGPARTPGHGIFRDVHELLPGRFLTCSREGERQGTYWCLQSQPHPDGFEDTAQKARSLLIDAVRAQTSAERPPSFQLSGGVDSSALCSLASRTLDMGRIRTVSVDYVDNSVNFRPSDFQPNTDAPWVLRVAEFLGSEHETCYIDTPELTEALFPAVTARGLPGMADIDASLLLFSKWIGQRDPISITGECADEVFAGYPWFYRPGDETTFPWSQQLAQRVQVLSGDLCKKISPEEYVRARYAAAVAETPELPGESPEQARKRELGYLTLTRWLPTLLDRQDRMSMAAGITLRAPFSDHRLVDYLWNVPWEMKFYKEREKGLLRHALAGVLPNEVLWRKKSPYPKTHNPNYIAALSQSTLSMLEDRGSPVRPLINVEAVHDLAAGMDRETNIPWFGQLMNAPQLLAYILQVNYWLRSFSVRLV